MSFRPGPETSYLAFLKGFSRVCATPSWFFWFFLEYLKALSLVYVRTPIGEYGS